MIKMTLRYARYVVTMLTTVGFDAGIGWPLPN